MQGGRRHDWWPLILAIGVLLAAVVPPPPAVGPADASVRIHQEWLRRWNRHRADAGLPEVVEREEYSHGNLLHARYMVDTQIMSHFEDPDQPAYTVEGDTASRSSNLCAGWIGYSESDFIDCWASAPFHAIGLLRPQLSEVGYGSATNPEGERFTAAAGAWVTPPPEAYAEPADYPVLWPAHGATTPLLAYHGSEYPEPLTHCPGFQPTSGLPILAQLSDPLDPPPSVTGAFLQPIDPPADPLPVCLLVGHTYRNPDTVAQDVGRQLLRGAAVVIPYHPLEPGTTYGITLVVNEQDLSWEFATEPDATATAGGGGPTAQDGPPPAGSPSITQLAAASPTSLSVAVSRFRFAPATASSAVLASSHTFADALAGTALSDTAPLLLTGPESLDADVRSELVRAVPAGSQVYVLGGEAVIAEAVLAEVRSLGYATTRFAGLSRIETAAAVAAEVQRRNPANEFALLARAYGPADDPTAAWADAVAVGAYAAGAQIPILLTPTEALHPSTAAAFAELGVNSTVVIGGPAAVSDAVEEASPAPQRIAGSNRAETAARIAAQLWDHAWIGSTLIDGYETHGWAAGLTAAGLGSTRGAPVLLTETEGLPPATAQALPQCASTAGTLFAVGTPVFTYAAVGQLRAAIDPGC